MMNFQSNLLSFFETDIVMHLITGLGLCRQRKFNKDSLLIDIESWLGYTTDNYIVVPIFHDSVLQPETENFLQQKMEKVSQNRTRF